MDRLRDEIGDLARCEEDVLTYAMFPDVGRTFLEERATGTLQPEQLLPPNETAEKPTLDEAVPTEFVVSVHGESYKVDIVGASVKSDGKRHFYVSLDGLLEEVVFEPLNEFVAPVGRRKTATAAGHVTTTMPGVILDVLVKEDELVRARQPLLIVEAMKMQTEVQAPIAGHVTRVHVAKGDRINPGEVLVEIEP